MSGTSVQQAAARTLVIGLGSIGRRHADILKQLGCDIAACTRQAACDLKIYANLEEAVEEHQPQWIVISNPTFEHHETLLRLYAMGIGLGTEIMVEKPLFSHACEDVSTPLQQRLAVAYNLRFHPVVLGLRRALQDEEPVAAQLYAGQHLPTWRPGRDYRTTYSASVAAGGGVLRDLSHELDLGLWLFGFWRRLVAYGGHFSDLDIQTEDSVGVMWEAARCPKVSVEINYLDRAPRRSILVHTRRHTWEADMIAGRLLCDGIVKESWTLARNLTYLAQARTWLNYERDILCSYEEGQAVLRMIEAIEQSISHHTWTTNRAQP